jgi:hypothetical protein
VETVVSCGTGAKQYIPNALLRRLAGYEDVNDADWQAHDGATRGVVGSS